MGKSLKKLSVTLLAITSVIASIICIVGLGITLIDYFDTSKTTIAESKTDSSERQQDKEKKQVQIVAMGDSLTRGSGDLEGLGYVGNLISNLEKKTDQKLILSNVGINGLTSIQLAEQVNQKEIQRQLTNADIVLITIGGNDLFRGGQGLTDTSEQTLLPIEAGFEKNLDAIFSKIRTVNEKADIFLIGLYNPFIELENAEQTSRIVRTWNFKSAEIAARYPKAVFVPTFDLFQLNVNDYLYTDQFHPNTEGYRLIGERVASLITMKKRGNL